MLSVDSALGCTLNDAAYCGHRYCRESYQHIRVHLTRYLLASRRVYCRFGIYGEVLLCNQKYIIPKHEFAWKLFITIWFWSDLSRTKHIHIHTQFKVLLAILNIYCKHIMLSVTPLNDCIILCRPYSMALLFYFVTNFFEMFFYFLLCYLYLHFIIAFYL